MSARTPRRSTRQTTAAQQHESPEKENTAKANGAKAAPKPKSTKAAARGRKVYCTCRQPDDGSPMILCAECREWYHFKCLDLDEQDAEDIQLFVCPSCHEKTGLHTVRDWEGPEALEARNTAPATISPAPVVKKASVEPEAAPVSEGGGSSDDASEDEYVAESAHPKTKRRRAHVASSGSESGSDEDTKHKHPAKHMRRPSTASTGTRVRTVSASPGPSVPSKRRQSTASQHPEPKRKRSESAAAGAGMDAARKYCLTKLQELFRDIFLRYPVLHDQPATDEGVPEKKPEDLSGEEKELLEAKAARFATELEECMYELYAEPDAKTGKHGVAAKYKERFRMLTFNLSKPDRVVLHKRIASSQISPKELSTMSSTDLADEETKQSIIQAEKEALAHSILKKTVMPRAKMTHKGIQDIEDVSGGAQRDREDREREREQEEEERIERERQERLKLQAQRAQARASLPPDSPVTPMTPSWGAPPPVPMHALQSGDPRMSPTTGRPPVNPLFVQTSSEMAPSPVEHELNLADLINIDEDPAQEVSISLATPAIPPISESASAATDGANDPTHSSSQSPPPFSATGISPFASRSAHPDLAHRPSFDLNALWSPKEDGAAGGPSDKPEAQDHVMDEESQQTVVTASPLGAEIIGEEANDQDFDMFLNEGEPEPEAPEPVAQTPEDIQAAFEAQGSVWTGKISMPLDSTIPQEVDVIARLAGGRKLDPDSPLWKTLFPVDHLRIDGRVPVDKSAQYLTQSRLNPTRELIAVAFSPESEASTSGHHILSKYLIDKGRHGLVFPWGHRPKDHHPGRELYIVPLMSTEPLPDFIELLDDLQLPKIRKADYMIGIWVLTKGKLAPPPTVPVPTPPVPPTPTPPIPAVAHVHGASDAHLPQHPTPPVTIPSIPMPPVSQPMANTPPPNPASGASAAVSPLTPEQIQLMLRTLSATTQQLSSLAPQQPAPPVPVYSPPIPSSMPPSTVPMQPWAHVPPFPPSYPPVPMPMHQGQPIPPPQGPYAPIPPPFPQDHGPYGAYPPPPNGHQFEPYGRGGGGGNERGHRGHRGGRNRGRGGGGGGSAQGGPQERPRDSGWGGRGRGRGRGGQGGGSPDRGQWGGSPQRWN